MTPARLLNSPIVKRTSGGMDHAPAHDQSCLGAKLRSRKQWNVPAARLRYIQLQVQSRLDASPYLVIRTVRCSVEEGELTLQGELPGFYFLQIAISLVRSVAGSDASVRYYLRVLS